MISKQQFQSEKKNPNQNNYGHAGTFLRMSPSSTRTQQPSLTPGPCWQDSVWVSGPLHPWPWRQNPLLYNRGNRVNGCGVGCRQEHPGKSEATPGEGDKPRIHRGSTPGWSRPKAGVLLCHQVRGHSGAAPPAHPALPRPGPWRGARSPAAALPPPQPEGQPLPSRHNAGVLRHAGPLRAQHEMCWPFKSLAQGALAL